MDYSNLIRKRTFILDTKTTCFLCLQEIHTDDDDSSCNNADSTGSIGDSNGEESDGVRISLRSILLYLELNPKRIFQHLYNNRSLKDTAQLLKQITNFSVSLCHECFQVTIRLSELCEELERIRMRVDHSLESFFERIAYSENDEQRVEKFRTKMMTGPLEFIQRTIAESLRKETKEKCRTKLNCANPKVNLGRIEDHPPPVSSRANNLPVETEGVQPVIISSQPFSPNPNIPILVASPILGSLMPVATTELSKSNHSPKPAVTLPQKNLSNEKFVNNLKLKYLLKTFAPEEKESPTPPTDHFPGLKIVKVKPNALIPRQSKPLPKLISLPQLCAQTNLQVSPAKPSWESGNSNRNQCNNSNKRPATCQHCTNGVFRNNIELSHHQAQLHSEKFFLSSKHQSVPERLFKKDCEQLIQMLVIFSKITPENSTTPKESFKCVYCADKKVINTWTRFYIHLVKAHPEVIAKKLVTLQEKKYGLELSQQEIINPKCSSRTLKRSESYLSAWLKQRRLAIAQVASRKNRMTTTTTPSKTSPLDVTKMQKMKQRKWKCKVPHCGKTFNHRTSLHVHREQMHPEQVQQQKPPEDHSKIPEKHSAHSTRSSFTSDSFSVEEDDNMIEETEVFPYFPNVSLKTEPHENALKLSETMTIWRSEDEESARETNTAMEELEVEHEEQDDNDDMNAGDEDDGLQIWVNSDVLE